jgi:hypothetical protein
VAGGRQYPRLAAAMGSATAFTYVLAPSHSAVLLLLWMVLLAVLQARCGRARCWR